MNWKTHWIVTTKTYWIDITKTLLNQSTPCRGRKDMAFWERILSNMWLCNLLWLAKVFYVMLETNAFISMVTFILMVLIIIIGKVSWRRDIQTIPSYLPRSNGFIIFSLDKSLNAFNKGMSNGVSSLGPLRAWTIVKSFGLPLHGLLVLNLFGYLSFLFPSSYFSKIKSWTICPNC